MDIEILVEEYTTPCPVFVGLETPLSEIKTLMTTNSIRHIPVLDGELPVGIISDRDVLVLMNHASEKNLIAQDIMTPGPLTIKSNVTLSKAAFELSKYKIGCAIVVDEEGKMEGIFTTTDALNALIELARG